MFRRSTDRIVARYGNGAQAFSSRVADFAATASDLLSVSSAGYYVLHTFSRGKSYFLYEPDLLFSFP